MPKKTQPSVRDIRVVPVVSLIVGVTLIVVAWTWWTKIYTSPQHVFWDMVDSSLSTTSVYKHISESIKPEVFNETIFLQFSPYDVAHANTIINEGGSTIQTEEINPPPADYVRYTSIHTITSAVNQNVAERGIINQWAKGSPISDTSSQLYNQSQLGVVLFGNVSLSNRQKLVRYAKDHAVYNVNYSDVSTAVLNERKTYKYTVTINPSAYVGLLRLYGSMLNLPAIANINAASYSSTPVTVTAYVDITAHNLLEVDYATQSHTESYRGYNISQAAPSIPTKTIPVTQLESRLYTTAK